MPLLIPLRNVIFGLSLVGITLALLATLTGFTNQVLPFRIGQDDLQTSASHSTSRLAQLALDEVLAEASPIFGHYSNHQTKTSTWMLDYPDDTPIVRMNIPGTHDSATWNYSQTTKQGLERITSLVNASLEIEPDHYRCQTRSLVQMLDAGIRAFDLRYAFDITNTTLTFWHGPGLQSQTATVEDVLFGFYKWLDDHPSEALFLSFQYEGSAAMHNFDNANVQTELYRILTSPAAQQYVLQTRGTFGTLGQARGKITLLRRFTLDQVHPEYRSTIPGIHFAPANWTVNGAEIALTYNTTTWATAYIEDYYRPTTPKTSSAPMNVLWKLNATEFHLRKAADEEFADSLFWSFASSTNTGHDPPLTPRMLALGDEKGEEGVNQRLVPIVKELRGKRLGIVMFDFFEEPEELIPLFLGLSGLDQAE